jgi:hypothetical protein
MVSRCPLYLRATFLARRMPLPSGLEEKLRFFQNEKITAFNGIFF